MERHRPLTLAFMVLSGLLASTEAIGTPRDLNDLSNIIIDEAYRSQPPNSLPPVATTPAPAVLPPAAVQRHESIRVTSASEIYWVWGVAALLAFLLWRKFSTGRARISRRTSTDRSRPHWRERSSAATPRISTEDAEAARRESGYQAELEVDEILRGLGIPVLHEIYVPHRGHHTEIDHLALVGSHIWVIETKGWSGDVLGKATDAEWQQVKRHDTKVLKNPLRQNEHHLGVLHGTYSRSSFRPVIVFTRARFPEGKPDGVFTLDELPDLVARDRTSIPDEETKRAWGDLSSQSGRQSKQVLRAQHSQRLEEQKTKSIQSHEAEDDPVDLLPLRAIRPGNTTFLIGDKK
ncbi:nuclease-related domain-containing protein [Azospirillum sp. TSA6c]|uniref:nuclease-related domain-containing protein n=1 Tax=Azospirillum sp. TSA6c TaxID=709813 RepID=UPI001304E175|nr:nuclease-related domain-containing protein [Azospirillum sp. TSA6c]